MDQHLDECGTSAAAQERGNSAAPDERKLPVLFHLMDVSRPRVAKPAVQPGDLASCAPTVHAGAELELELALAPLTTSPLGAAPSSAVTDDAPASAFVSGAAFGQALESLTSVPGPLETAPADHEAAPVSDPVQEQISPAIVEPSVSLPPSRQSNRCPRPATNDDWFAAHGKFIAVAFVLALVGTIYFARTTPRAPTPREETVRPVAPLIELTSTSESTSSAAIPAASKSAPPLAATNSASPAPVAPATVELHMPTPPATQLTANSEKAPTNTRSADSLFVFPAKKPEVDSTPPAQTALTAAPPVPAGSRSATMASAYPVTTSAFPPSAAPAAVAYPQTPAPPLGAPGSPNAYSAMSPPAGPPLPAWPPAPQYGQPRPYQSPDNVARGPRYERTGSGNY